MVYTANWGIIWYLPPIKGTRKLYWLIPPSNTRLKTHNYMGVSKNSGTPKSSILIGCSIINHPFWGIPIFGNTHIGIQQVGYGDFPCKVAVDTWSALIFGFRDGMILGRFSHQRSNQRKTLPTWPSSFYTAWIIALLALKKVPFTGLVVINIFGMLMVMVPSMQL